MVEKCIPKEKKREKTNKKHLVEEEIDESAVCSCTYAKKWQKIKEEEYPVWNKQIQYTTIGSVSQRPSSTWIAWANSSRSFPLSDFSLEFSICNFEIIL